MVFCDHKKYMHALIIDCQKDKNAQCTTIKKQSGGANKEE